jgi:hypothetical protein
MKRIEVVRTGNMAVERYRVKLGQDGDAKDTIELMQLLMGISISGTLPPLRTAGFDLSWVRGTDVVHDHPPGTHQECHPLKPYKHLLQVFAERLYSNIYCNKHTLKK